MTNITNVKKLQSDCTATVNADNCRHSLVDTTIDKYQMCYDAITDLYNYNTIHISGQCPSYANQSLYIFKAIYNTSIKYIYAGTTDYIGYAKSKKVMLSSVINPYSYYPFNLIFFDSNTNIFNIVQVTSLIVSSLSGDGIRVIGYEVPLSECSNKVTNGTISCNSYVHTDGLYFLRDEMILLPTSLITLDSSGMFRYDHIVGRAGVYDFFLADMNYNIISYLGGETIKPVLNSINIINLVYNPNIGISGKIEFVGMSTPLSYNGYIANDTSGHILKIDGMSDNTDFLFPETLCTNGTNRIRVGLLDVTIRGYFFETVFHIDVNLPCKSPYCDFNFTT